MTLQLLYSTKACIFMLLNEYLFDNQGTFPEWGGKFTFNGVHHDGYSGIKGTYLMKGMASKLCKFGEYYV